MCLRRIAPDFEKKLVQKLKTKAKKGYIVLWKSFKKNSEGQLCSPYYFKLWSKNIYTVSNRLDKKLLAEEKYEIRLGIHVALTRSQARLYGPCVRKVKCLIRDLVAVGYDNEAVFMKAKLYE